MTKVDLFVAAPHFYTMDGDGVGYLPDAAMAVDRGKIVAIGERDTIVNDFQPERSLDCENQVVLPGFIDAHIHTHDCLMRGLAQDTGYWMMYGLAPFDQQITPESSEAGTQLAVVEGLRAGTTTFGDFGSAMDPVCRFLEKVGARGSITVTIREAVSRVYDPGDLYEFDPSKGERSLNECRRVFDEWHNQAGGRITVMFGPQGPDFVGKDLLLRTRQLALERRTRIHMHTQQGDRETAQMEKRYGKRPIAWLDEIGYLDEHLLAVHLTDAAEDEARLVAERGASMVLCSGSIGIIDGIVPPAVAFQNAGGNVALGSDQAPGNNCHNIFNEMKLTALFNKIRHQDPEVMPAWRALRMATIEGARALGLDSEIGSLVEGKKADFITVDLATPTMAPVFTHPMRNIVPNLVYSARGDEVRTVVVDGKVIFEDGSLVNVDEAEILDNAQRWASPLGDKAAEEFSRVNGTNAVFMRQGRL